MAHHVNFVVRARHLVAAHGQAWLRDVRWCVNRMSVAGGYRRYNILVGSGRYRSAQKGLNRDLTLGSCGKNAAVFVFARGD